MNTNWSPEELEYIKSEAADKQPYHLGLKLNRTAKAIYHKADGAASTRAKSATAGGKYHIGQTVRAKSIVHDKIMEGVITYIHPADRFVVVSFSSCDRECFPIYALLSKK